MTEIREAWAAGLFDGEGSVGVYRKVNPGRAPYWVVQASLAVSHEPTATLFLEIVASGKIYMREPRSARHRPMFVWIASARALDPVLEILRCYSVTRLVQIELAIAARTLQVERRRRAHSSEAQRRLIEISERIAAANGNQKGGRRAG